MALPSPARAGALKLFVFHLDINRRGYHPRRGSPHVTLRGAPAGG